MKEPFHQGQEVEPFIIEELQGAANSNGSGLRGGAHRRKDDQSKFANQVSEMMTFSRILLLFFVG